MGDLLSYDHSGIRSFRRYDSYGILYADGQNGLRLDQFDNNKRRICLRDLIFDAPGATKADNGIVGARDRR
jgi:hypothetical protein